jgi:hypothetical protein
VSAVKPWAQADAIALCRAIEAICPDYGCHVALTGGLLYKDGERKDCDILFYRIRQVDEIDVEGLFAALSTIGVERVSGFGWVYKAVYQGKPIDCFFPESDRGEYERAEEQDRDPDLMREEWRDREALEAEFFGGVE